MRLFSKKKKKPTNTGTPEVAIPPGRISQPDDGLSQLGRILHGKDMVQPSTNQSLIQFIRDLYKVNPDMGIALQDMFKLANTGHYVRFHGATEKEVETLTEHFKTVTRTWSDYTAGVHGLVNKMIVQNLVSGAISIEAIPNKDLTGIETIVFVKPETIRFRRNKQGRYHPYQRVPHVPDTDIKLNPETYTYISMFNDLDEPYGIPPFLPSLEPLDGQSVLKSNYKNMMEQAGLLGFMEVTMAKSPKRATESESAYKARLEDELRQLKINVSQGMTDGLVTGHTNDHVFNFHATTEKMGNVEKFWNMNQQSVANGLGVSGNIIGIANANTEGGAGILLSTMISQLRNIQQQVAFALEKVYSLELRLIGKTHVKPQVTFGPSTISDELKVQQGVEIKVRNLIALYNQGIISQEDLAREMGYDKPDEKEPRIPLEDPLGDSAAKKKREADKDSSDRGGRDKKAVNPKRNDQDPTKRNT